MGLLLLYLLEFELAVGVEGSEEQLVPNPVTPTSPTADNPPRAQRPELPSDPSFCIVASFCRSLCICVCFQVRATASFLPICLDKHFLSVNTGEPGTPPFP